MINQLELVLKQEIESRMPSRVVEAMGYSLLSEGKRVRPNLLFKLMHDFGVVNTKALYAAAAIECVHTYSLIHDDLPALDDDDIRRFKPTNHIVYGEDMAILAGDGLLTMAFSMLAKGELGYEFTEILSRNSGVRGMILGQELDILDNINSLEDLILCYELKTGGLFSAALEMAAYLSGQEAHLETVATIGKLLGIVFQFQDDLLEVQSSSEVIGKSNQSDQERNKSTIMSYMDLNKAQTLVDTYFLEIENLIDSLNLKHQDLKNYIHFLAKRSI